jgi:hypothetical protein
VRRCASGTVVLGDRDVEREYAGKTQVHWKHDEHAGCVRLSVGPLPPPAKEEK